MVIYNVDVVELAHKYCQGPQRHPWNWNGMYTASHISEGSGHAGSCAALSAREAGCQRVVIVDKCPPEWVGGNGYFTAGAHRTVHGGLQDLLPIVQNVTPDEAENIDMNAYTADEFTRDIMRLGDDRSDPEVVKAVVDGSRDAVQWLADRVKVPFILSFHRQAYLVNGRQVFWGGLVLSVEDGGKGLIAAHRAALAAAGVETWFNTAAVELLVDGEVVVGVAVDREGTRLELRAPAVILACGGFEANKDLRGKHLGADWERAKVRGTPYNTGDGLMLAQRVGARLAGDFAGCHSTCWDANAPADRGDRVLSNQFTKSGYPLGLMLNVRGARFVDEGADFRNYTYAKFGRAILAQPGGIAFQVWDSTVTGLLRKEEYADDVVEQVWADTLEALAEKLRAKGLEDPGTFVQTIRQYNAATAAFRAEHPKKKWDPAVKDGMSTQARAVQLELPKSNWALPFEKPPYLAIKVACGVTFTFGGLMIDPDTASVISEATGKPIRGLFCTGELVGGLFYGNYPGGSGLTNGAVFGKKAGRSAAKLMHVV
ncbi:FAD/NAD-P-binding domain-containing protein [Trametes meyenii]|nr:FAD/NAD-P-binding domain-containing protein [Trametes meyenii]